MDQGKATVSLEKVVTRKDRRGQQSESNMIGRARPAVRSVGIASVLKGEAWARSIGRGLWICGGGGGP